MTMPEGTTALLEVIALDAADARAARDGGADRLELVSDMAADGLTPTVETFREIRAAVALPLRVMLRLSDGFEAGGTSGVTALVDRATRLRAAGAREFVLGFLDPEGDPDLDTLKRLADVLDGCAWTFHRAVDRSRDREALRAQLDGLPGLDTYLTAGAAGGVDEGLTVLCEEAAREGGPGYTQRLLVGGGLRLDHLPALRAAGISAFHIGGAARPAGWDGPVDAAAVERWREALG
ncbi:MULTISPECIES: copper homeostasis protein CutC [unclassified Streptomyces]|uniref:copper homeostasis protein CutC n=1 Tax=unclassified Streptomyces TaxID=2593676 RepID=UPI000B857BF3|nr:MULTISPECIES: copper homeostasis protein CutC [unclassified Streptomyces]MYR26568.1 copper homeostasis protein CutC [Streptomyces sp. SID4945]